MVSVFINDSAVSRSRAIFARATQMHPSCPAPNARLNWKSGNGLKRVIGYVGAQQSRKSSGVIPAPLNITISLRTEGYKIIIIHTKQIRLALSDAMQPFFFVLYIVNVNEITDKLPKITYRRSI